MTSLDPGMLQFDPNAVDAKTGQPLFGPDQAAVLQAARAQAMGGAPSPPASQPDLTGGAAPGYGTGNALGNVAGVLAAGPMGDFTPENANRFEQGARNAGKFIYNLGAGATHLYEPMASNPASGATPAATPGAPQQLQQQPLAYQRPGGAAARIGGAGGGGTGLGGIARQQAELRKQFGAQGADEIERAERDQSKIANAETDLAAVQSNTAEQVAQAHREGLAAQAQIQADQDAYAAAGQQKLADADAKLTAEADENAKLIQDPNRYWHNLSTAGKIGSGVAVMLGALGAGLTHGPNMALQSMEDAINKDIDAQKENIHQKNQSLATHQRMHADRRAAFNDDINFYNMKKASAWDDVVKKAQSYDLSNQPAEIQAMAQKNIAEAQAKADDFRAQVKQRTLGQVSQSLAAEANTRNMQNDNALGWAQVNAQKDIAAMKAGAKGAALSNTQKARINDIDAALRALEDDKSPGAVASAFQKIIPFVSNEAKRHDDAREANAQVVGRGIQGGVLTADENEVWKNQLPMSTDSDATKAAKNGALRKKLMNAKESIYGMPGTEDTSLEGL